MNKKITLLSGARLDYYEEHGPIFSPRLNLQYKPGEYTQIRLNSGTGFRVVNLFTEDHAFVSGQRELVIEESLNPERSYNIGLGLMHTYSYGNQQGSIELDGFYTYFTNKIIPDYSEAGLILYRNSDAYAYTRGLSLNLNHQWGAHLYFNLGIQWQNARQAVYENGEFIEEIPIIYSRDWSSVGAVEYEFPKNYFLNYNFTFNGPTAMPEVYNLNNQGSIIDNRPLNSPSFAQHNIKIRKEFNQFEFFIGVRNLFDNVQVYSPLSGTNDETAPIGFSPYFDTAYNYGSVLGRNFFGGFNWRLKNEF